MPGERGEPSPQEPASGRAPQKPPKSPQRPGRRLTRPRGGRPPLTVFLAATMSLAGVGWGGNWNTQRPTGGRVSARQRPPEPPRAARPRPHSPLRRRQDGRREPKEGAAARAASPRRASSRERRERPTAPPRPRPPAVNPPPRAAPIGLARPGGGARGRDVRRTLCEMAAARQRPEGEVVHARSPRRGLHPQRLTVPCASRSDFKRLCFSPRSLLEASGAAQGEVQAACLPP